MTSTLTTPDYRACMTCAGFNLRKANRAISQFYDEVFRPLGIRGTQYPLLVAVKLTAPELLTQLADYAQMDRTTLTRNMELLVNQGLLTVSPGPDKRTRNVNITADGVELLELAYPLWQQAQAKISAGMGAERLADFLADLSALVDVSQHS